MYKVTDTTNATDATFMDRQGAVSFAHQLCNNVAQGRRGLAVVELPNDGIVWVIVVRTIDCTVVYKARILNIKGL